PPPHRGHDLGEYPRAAPTLVPGARGRTGNHPLPQGRMTRSGCPAPPFYDQKPHAFETAHRAVDGNVDDGETLGMRLHEVADLERPSNGVGSVAPPGGKAGCGSEDGREVTRGRN